MGKFTIFCILECFPTVMFTPRFFYCGNIIQWQYSAI